MSDPSHGQFPGKPSSNHKSGPRRPLIPSPTLAGSSHRQVGHDWPRKAAIQFHVRMESPGLACRSNCLIADPTSVKPGSYTANTVRFSFSSRRTRRLSCVDFPHASPPSNVTKRPGIQSVASDQCQLPVKLISCQWSVPVASGIRVASDQCQLPVQPMQKPRS